MIFFEILLAVWWVGIAYLIGSIPFGLVLTRIFKMGDVRKVGSGNIGTTNVLRMGNKKVAAATLVLDYVKGLLPTLMASGVDFGNGYLPYIVAISCIIGHIFPIWLKFEGGKGVATGGGTVMALNPLLGIIAIIAWLATARITRISSLAALVGYTILPVIAIFITNWQTVLTLFIILLIIIWTHRENIKRILKGEESEIEV